MMPEKDPAAPEYDVPDEPIAGLTLLNLSARKRKRLVAESDHYLEPGTGAASDSDLSRRAPIARRLVRRLRTNRRRMAAVIIALLISSAALAAVADRIIYPNGNGFLSALSNKIGITQTATKTVGHNSPIDPNAPTQVSGMQLSKEYIYAGARLLAVEDYNPTGGNPTPPGNGTRQNMALAANGGSITASSQLNAGFSPQGVINGDRKGVNWFNNGGWADGTLGTFPDAVQINFNGTKQIDEINVITSQDNWEYPSEPTSAMTFSLYGAVDYDVLYWNGAAWTPVSGGIIVNNYQVWRTLTFAPVQTNAVRVVVNRSVDNCSRLIEVEALGVASSASLPAPPSL